MSTGHKLHKPKRILSSGFSLAVTIGGMIGLGILRTPGEVAEVVQPSIGICLPLAIMVSSLFAVLQLRSIALGAKIQQIAAVAMVIIVMTLANQNLLYLSTPRILQALAVDGLAVRFAGKFSNGGKPENDKLNQRHQLNRVLISDKIPNKLLHRLRIIRSFLLKSPITTLIFQFIKRIWYRRPVQKWDKFKAMNPLSYPIFKDINSVPNGVWKNTSLIVERYINNCEAGLFYVYCCVFFGDKEITQRLE